MAESRAYDIDDFLIRRPGLVSSTRVLQSTGPFDFLEDPQDMADAYTSSGANIAPPEQDEIYRLDVTASSVAYNLPATWGNKFVTIRAIGDDVQYQFGRVVDTLSLTADQTSGGTPPTMTANSASGATIKDGETDSFRIFGVTQFAIISATASAVGYFEIWLSEHSDT